MADNITAGVDGVVVAAKDIGGVQYPRNIITDETGAAVDFSAIANVIGSTKYETVAASQTGQVLGTTGAVGNHLIGLLVIPATTSPGTIAILDHLTSITVFTGGASSVSNLVPFFIPIQAMSVNGAWKVTTGANVSVLAVGRFS